MVKVSRRKKKSAQAKEERAALPLLFNCDPGQNFTAWMQRVFPASTIDPKDAIRLWLNGHENTAAINATPVTRALFQTAHPVDHLSDRSQVPLPSYDPTTHHIQEAVFAALATALGKDRSFSFTGSSRCGESDQVHQSPHGFVEQHYIGLATKGAVQPDAHSPARNTEATKFPTAPSGGLTFKLPVAPLIKPDASPDNQSHVGLESGVDHDLGSAVKRGSNSTPKFDGSLETTQPKHPNEKELFEQLLSRSTSRSCPKEEQVPRSGPAAVANTESSAQQFSNSVHHNMVHSHLSFRATGSVPSSRVAVGGSSPPLAKPNAPQRGEIAVEHYWDRYRSDIYLGISILILMTVILASFR